MITMKRGGVGWFPTTWAANWDTQPLFSFDPPVRVPVLGTIVATTAWWVCTAGSDQMAIKRYLATRDAGTARRAFLINNVAEAGVTLVLALLGFALLGFFSANPQYLSANLNLRENADLLFPHFIVNFIGYGIAGLVVSGMLSAAMSSLSSGINATCTVLNTDIMGYFLKRQFSEKQKLVAAQWTSFLIGVVVVALSLIVANVRGNLVEMTSKTSNLLVGPLFGLFFFAMFVPFATPLGAAFGSLYGFLAAFLVSFWDVAGGTPLSWQWILPTAVVVNIIAGTVTSLIPYQNRSRRFLLGLCIAFSIPFVIIMTVFISACARSWPPA
jgi:SSS family solute:Na+ symporter